MDPYGTDIKIPFIQILKPEMKYLYINFNDKFELQIPFFITLIVGKIDIEVEASDLDSGINRVEYYIDNKLKASDTTWPYMWTWKTPTFLLPYEIKVKAYDNTENYNIVKIKVWKFF